MLKRHRHSTDDRKAKAEAKAFAPLGSFAALELLENHFALGIGNAWARVINRNADLTAAWPRTNQHMADFRIANRVGSEVLIIRRNISGSDMTQKRVRRKRSVTPLSTR